MSFAGRPAAPGLADPGQEARETREMETREILVRQLTERLRRGDAASEIDRPRAEARLLLDRAHELVGAAGSGGGFPSETRLLRVLVHLVRERLDGKPVSRILGRREFWSMEFGLCPACLDPRPDSETLIEAVLGEARRRSSAWQVRRVLDAGTGSGCLLAALLASFPDATGTGIDRSEAALQTADRNLHRLGFASRAELLHLDWQELPHHPSHHPSRPAGQGYDVILVNPPYIPHAQIPTLPRPVRLYDPPGALDGGPDGLAGFRSVLPVAQALLRPDGVLVVEIAHDQADRVSGLVAETGRLRVQTVCRDLAGQDRCLVIVPSGATDPTGPG